MAEADRVDRGELPDEARQRARREFGNVGLVKQVAREVSGWGFVDRLAQDLRHSVRRLWARPATTCLAMVMLGLAVGITTAMFTLVDAFFLRPFPFQDGERIALYSMRSKGGGRRAVATSVYRAWRDSGVFEATEAVDSPVQLVLETPSGPTVRVGAYVTPGLFQMLGVRPIRGRGFDATEGRAGQNDRVVISEDMWLNVFDGDPEIVGRRVMLGSESVVVIGVMPRDFRFPEWNTEIWRPVDFLAQSPGRQRLPMVYAKRPASLPEADALRVTTDLAHAADVNTAQLWAEDGTSVRSIWSGTQYIRTAVRLLAAGVVLVFVVLCTNVSSLLLARFNARRRDVALSSALGASRTRLLWQASVENVLLGAIGAAIGVALAFWLVSVTRVLLPQAFVVQSLNPLNVDQRALAVAALLAIVATLLAGLLPAWIGTRGTPAQSVLTRTSTDARGARAMSRAFLITEVALACALLVGASLLVRSFVNLSNLSPGFSPSGIVSMWVQPDRARATDATARWAAMNTALAELAGLPGVSRVVRSSGVPLFADSGTHWYDLEGTEPGAVLLKEAEFQTYDVGTDWFEMFGVRILRGRDFVADEDDHHVILGAGLASALWPSRDPIGQSFRWNKDVYQVIGVAADLRSPVEDLEDDYHEIYQRFGSTQLGSTLSLRCDAGCPSEGLIRQRLAQAAPALEVIRVAHLETLYREQLSQPRAMAMLGVLFGALALVVAAGGLFSVLSHTVGRRRREFGIRLVLGSTPGQIRRLVLREGLLTASAGIALGAFGGWLATSSLAALLYGVTSTDALSWSLVLTTLIAATAAGAWQPAARATRIDPGTLLREE